MSTSTTKKETTAHYFVEGLLETGFDYLFSNLGTDHVSLIEAMATWRQQGRKPPQTILCPHENVALHMAGGYALATGKGQAVMVHVDAGTANAAMGMHNLFRTRTPVLLLAGKAPFTMRGELPASRDNYVHFVQDPYDIASVVRPYTKWEYNLPSGVVVKEALRRAHTMMHSDPPGPVYMTLPRETLAEPFAPEQIRSFEETQFGPVKTGGISAEQAQALADQLIQAERPVIVTAYLGRNPAAVPVLEALAECLGIPVHQFFPTHMNVSQTHPCFAGFDVKQAVENTDCGLLLDVDVPWLPVYTQPSPEARWIHIDIDTVKKDFPMWGFATHHRVQADCEQALRQILQVVEQKMTPALRARAQARLQALAAATAQRQQGETLEGQQPGKKGELNPAYVCARLNQQLNASDVIVNEAIRNAGQVWKHVQRTEPGTLFSTAGGGLGYSGGMALGIKLARPDVRVVQVVGDGGFHFSTPTSVYAVAQQYQLPILTVVLDNGGWQAVKEAVLRVYPEGEAKARNEFEARLEGVGHRRFDRVGQAFGAHGEYVDDPADLDQALQRCLKANEQGQAAVLQVAVSKL